MIKKKKKSSIIYNLILSISFIALVGGVFIANNINEDLSVSYLENRKLKEKPEFSMENLIDGSYSSEFEEYISDQFIFRDYFIKNKAKIEMVLGKNKINNVFIGDDNYLFEDFKSEPKDEIKIKTNVINEFTQKNNELNVSMMLVPTAIKIYEEKVPQYSYVDDELQYINFVKSNLNSKINFIELYDTLRDNKDKNLFYKSDHHWTTKGAYIAYTKMCKDLNLEYKKEDEYTIKNVSSDFYGSLYYKLGAGIGEEDKIDIYIPKNQEKVVVDYVEENIKESSLYNSDKLDEKDKYEVFMGGNHSIVKIKTLSKEEKKLLVIKDSYANSFIPFLTNNYSEIVVLDLRYYNDEIQNLITSEEITDVLFLYNVNTFNEDKSILNLIS